MSNCPEITLTWGEFQVAIFIGGQRMMRAVRARRSEPYGHPSERGDWDVVMEGACAEMAVAKHLGMYWSDFPNLDYDGDVGRYQVRSTDLPHGHLLIYPRDRDDAPFILAAGRAPTFSICGWILAGEAKRLAPSDRMRSPCWEVSQEMLASIESLPR